MRKTVVIKITGTLFDLDNGMNRRLDEVAKTLRDLVDKGFRFVVVTGGGQRLRRLIEELRRRGAGEGELDALGIEVTRVNAKVMSVLLGNVGCPVVPRSLEDALILAGQYGIVCMGGVLPGFSTNAVAALMAEMMRANLLVMMTRAGAVYDKDPSISREAKPLKEIRIDELFKILSAPSRAGYYPLLDRVSLEIIRRSGINTVVIPPDGKMLKAAVIEGKAGTRILV